MQSQVRAQLGIGDTLVRLSVGIEDADDFSPGVHRGYDYARTKNPTRMAFERCVAEPSETSHGLI